MLKGTQVVGGQRLTPSLRSEDHTIRADAEQSSTAHRVIALKHLISKEEGIACSAAQLHKISLGW
jgi:hypothetical protein